MEDYDKSHWETKCPKIDCDKEACRCGLKYISVPAPLENTITPTNGRFSNAIVLYEGSGKVYIYSTEGVPVLVKEGNAS